MYILKRAFLFLLGLAIFTPSQFIFRMAGQERAEGVDEAAVLIFQIPAFFGMCLAAWIAFGAGRRKKDRADG